MQEERTRLEQERRRLEAERQTAEAAKRQAATDEELRRAQEERTRLEQERKRIEAEKQAAETAKRQAAADEGLRRVQEERTRLEQERKRIEAEKQAAEAAKKQVEASQRAASAAAMDAPGPAASYDGTYSGRFCNNVPNKAPNCWPVALTVRSGVTEGNWISKAKKPAGARGTVAADGTVRLNLKGWTPGGAPAEASLRGRIADGAITASGQWGDGTPVSGSWKRTQTGPAGPPAPDVPKLVASYDGTYSGRFCNQFPKKAPFCWPVALVVRDGVAEGNWIGSVKQQGEARGAVGADGVIRLKLTTLTPNGTPAEANLIGRVADGAITVSGQWRNGPTVAGDWKRNP